MIHQLKFLHSPESRVFFTSDMHYGQACESWDIPLWKNRGYNSLQEHDAAMIQGWNGRITDNDIVFHLGDFTFGRNAEANMQFLLENLHYKELYLLFGNHYAGIKQFFNKYLNYSIDKYYRLGFIGKVTNVGVETEKQHNAYLVPNYYEIFVNKTPAVLSHYPILSWNGAGKGENIHLFGHSHGNLGNSGGWIKDNYLAGRCMDVGVDAVGSPLDFDEIMKILGDRPAIKVDHHNQTTSSPF